MNDQRKLYATLEVLRHNFANAMSSFDYKPIIFALCFLLSFNRPLAPGFKLAG